MLSSSLRRLRARGFLLIVVSNQSGIAEGRFPERRLRAVRHRIDRLLAAYGVALHDFYYCPHARDAQCRCRKPRAGLLRRAARRHGVNLAASWMIGDILDDVEAGHAAGCRAILLDNGGETEWRPGVRRRPDFRVRTLEQAAGRLSMRPRGHPAERR